MATTKSTGVAHAAPRQLGPVASRRGGQRQQLVLGAPDEAQRAGDPLRLDLPALVLGEGEVDAFIAEQNGVAPGAVTPFGAINDTTQRVTVVLDAALMEHAVINAHPLTNTMTTSIGRDDLVKFLESTGHEPRIVEVAGPYLGPDLADG